MDVSFLRKKKLVILGFGKEGESLLNFLSKYGLSAAVLDQKENLKLPAGVLGTLGPDYLNHLTKFDIIFRTPGFPRLHPSLLAAEKKGVEVSSQTKLFFQLCPGPIIGVTGTKGKGTTATIIYEILKTAGLEVFLGGNVGRPPLDFLPQLTPQTLAVLELSSFQLEDLNQSPQYAAVLSITSDHLNHHKSQGEYIEAKINIVAHQKSNDCAILDADSETTKQFALKTPARKIWFSQSLLTEPGAFRQKNTLYLNLGGKPKKICEITDLKLPGPHNVSNTLAAAAAAAASGAAIAAIRKGVTEFSGLPHRLEFVAKIKKVAYYNDSAATLPDATIAALESFSKPKILILGGSEKGANYQPLIDKILNSDIRATILTGTTGKKIKKLLGKSGFAGKILEEFSDMTAVVQAAANAANAGDVVLLTPASASFDMFKNYEDRGEQFKRAVNDLRANEKQL